MNNPFGAAKRGKENFISKCTSVSSTYCTISSQEFVSESMEQHYGAQNLLSFLMYEIEEMKEILFNCIGRNVSNIWNILRYVVCGKKIPDLFQNIPM